MWDEDWSSSVGSSYPSRRRHTRCYRDWSSDVCSFFSSRRRHTRCYRDWSSDVCSSDLDVERPGELFLRELFSPYPQEILPARDAGNLEVPLFVRRGQVRALEDHDVGEHLGMDVAELPVDPRPFERVGPGLPLLPGAEVVALPVRREAVVLERIAVPELHRGSYRYRKHVRDEHPALLVHRWPLRMRPRRATGEARDKNHHGVLLWVLHRHPPHDPAGLQPGDPGR